MNQHDSNRIHELCSQIAVEHDQRKFLILVEELNKILSEQDKYLPDKTEKSSG